MNTMRGYLLAVAAALILTAAPAGAVDAGLLDLAAPDVNFAVGIRVADIVSSPLVEKALEKVRSSDVKWLQAIFAADEDVSALVEEALILADVEPGAAKQQTPDALVLVRGSARRLTDILCLAGCVSSRYRNYEIRMNDEGEKSVYFTALDATYAALGTDKAVRAVIDRRLAGARSGAGEAIGAWVERMNAHHIWLAAKGPFETPGQASAPAIPALSSLSALEGVGLGLTLGDDVVLGLELRAASEEEARKLFDAANGFLALSAMAEARKADTQPSGAQKPAFTSLLKNLELTREATVLRASLRVPQQELVAQFERGVEQAAAGLVTARSASPAPQQPWAAPPRKRQGVIRIHGLGGKPVEVESQPIRR